MKRLLLLLLAIPLVWKAPAQDTIRVDKKEKEIISVIEDSVQTVVKSGDKDVITVTEDSTGTVVRIGNKGIIVVDDRNGDTVKIRIGNRTIKIIESEGTTSVKTSREPLEQKEKPSKFNGHWGGFELGFNTLHKSDYSLYQGTPYEGDDFFDLNHSKSLTINLNIAEVAFSNERKTIGIVSGLGFSFMDFRFDNPDFTIGKRIDSPYFIEPVHLEKEAQKSKLNAVYLTAPLILEIATPLKLKSQHLTLGAGVIGGLNIGSHTKVKYKNAKEKERGNFNLNPLKYEFTGRLGLGEFCLFANYGMTPLFKNGKGPELVPLTFGIAFPNISF